MLPKRAERLFGKVRVQAEMCAHLPDIAIQDALLTSITWLDEQVHLITGRFVISLM